MSVLDVTKLKFTYGEETLYHDASFRLFEGEHAVLVGPNGSGKTTLLKLLNHQLIPDSGRIEWHPHKRIGYLDQHQKIDDTLKVKQYLYAVFYDLFDKEQKMEQWYEEAASADPTTQAKLLNRAAKISDELLDSDFYAIKSEVGKIIHGLGLSLTILDQPIKILSGGMRSKVILAKLLLESADVLLLDEPTNFLDIKHIEWLTKFLQNYDKAFIVVSHHEAFLKAIATSVLALEGGQIARYKGDFNYYLQERILRHNQHEKAYVSQQKLIERTEDFIRKNIVRDSTTKRAQSRRKMLEKLPRIGKPLKTRTYRFKFPIGRRTGKEVLVLNDLVIGYEHPLVEPLSLTVRSQEKVVVTGKNGIGKTTLIKTILNQLQPLNGTFDWIDTADIGYFAQDLSWKKDMTPFQLVHEQYPDFDRRQILSLLATHGLDFDQAHRIIDTLSGGEQTKTRLALMRHIKANVLIFDEPTNHLDAAAKDALKEAMIDYQGTLILVSHEPDFYQDICDYEITLYAE